MAFEVSDRIKVLPPYLFADLDRQREEAKARGIDVIDLGVGDPDRPTPDNIIRVMSSAIVKASNHQYPAYSGMNIFREAVADWYARRHGVTLNPFKEVCSLIGSKEGIAHFPLAFVDPGDVVLVPEPAYPVYNIGTIFAGGQSYFMPLLEKNKFLPDFTAIPADILKKAKIIWVNYPNNPTGAIASVDFYEKLIKWAKEHNIIVASDAAYSEMTFNNKLHPSILELPGALDVAIEFHSLSKTYNMTGWRLGWAAGNAELVGALGRIKSNVDSGIFQAIQEAGVEALAGEQVTVREQALMYSARRDILVRGLKGAGLTVYPTDATFYVWAKVPQGQNSAGFAATLLNEAGIVATPGNGFGPSGEGYVRFALVEDVEVLAEVSRRLAQLKF